MEPEKVKELVEMMKENDLTELEIVDGQTRIMLKRGTAQSSPQMVAMTPALAVNGSAVPVMESTSAAQSDAKVEEEKIAAEKNLAEIKAPMVGSFYTAPSPNAESFIEVGSKVEEDTVICIIEAMKVMNEIKSEVRGTIKEILASNGASVEYGQPLFLVEPE